MMGNIIIFDKFRRPFDWESLANGLKVKYQICASLDEVIHQAAICEPALIIIILGPKIDPQEIRLKLQAYLHVSPEVSHPLVPAHSKQMRAKGTPTKQEHPPGESHSSSFHSA